MDPKRAEQNIELVLRGWLLPARERDTGTIAQHLHDDVFWQGVHPDYHRSGRDEVLAQVADEQDPPSGIHRLELTATGEHVLVSVAAAELDKIGKVDAGGQVFLVFTIRDGKIARIDDRLTRAEALAVAGMEEPPPWR